MQTLVDRKLGARVKKVAASVGIAASIACACSKSKEATSLSPRPSPEHTLVQRTPPTALAQLSVPRTGKALEAVSATVSSLALLASSVALVRAQGRDPSRAANMAHRFSWLGWTIDSAAGVMTLLAAQSWGLAAARACAVVANATGTWLSRPLVSKEGPQGLRGGVAAFMAYARDPRERANLVCLGLATTAIIFVTGLKLSGGELSGVNYHVVAAMGLLGFVFSSVPTIREFIQSLRERLPQSVGVSKVRFLRDSLEVLAWPVASVAAIPLAFLGKTSWATWGWVALPLILNLSILGKAWRNYVRDSSKGSCG